MMLLCTGHCSRHSFNSASYITRCCPLHVTNEDIEEDKELGQGQPPNM